MYPSAVMPLICAKLPTPDQAKHPHMILQLPYFIAFWIFISLRASSVFCHTLDRRFCPNNSNLLSSDYNIFFQKSSIFTFSFLTNSNLFFLFILLMKGRFDANMLFSPDSLSLRRTVRLLAFRFIDFTIFRDDSSRFCFTNNSGVITRSCSPLSTFSGIVCHNLMCFVLFQMYCTAPTKIAYLSAIILRELLFCRSRIIKFRISRKIYFPLFLLVTITADPPNT